MKQSPLVTVASFSALIGLLAILVLSPPAAAGGAPPEDRGWGAAGFETDNARYQTRVKHYEFEAEKLTLRNQQIAAELQLVWATWDESIREKYEKKFDGSYDGVQHRARVLSEEKAERDARNLHHDFITACARCDTKKPDVRERAFNFHLDYLRLRNIRAASRNRYLAVKTAHIKSSFETAHKEWLRDNREDLVYVVEKMLKKLPLELYNSCIKGVLWKRISDDFSYVATGLTPSSGANLAVRCLQSAVFGTLVEGIVDALKKQFYDDLARRGIHREVAVYWMSSILLPKTEGAEAWEEYFEKLTVGLMVREIRRQFADVLNKDLWEKTRIIFANNPDPSRAWPSDAIQKQAIDAYNKGMADIKKMTDRLRALTFVAKLTEKVVPLIFAKWDFDELERLEIPKYWKIRNCLASRTDPPRPLKKNMGGAIVDILKLPPKDYVKFLTECRGREQASCPANIEKAKALISEAAQTRTAINGESGAGRIKSIGESLRALEKDLAGLSDEINRAALKNTNLCATLKTEQQILTDLLKRVRDDALKTTTLRDQARRNAGRACEADDVPVAESEARSAKDAADKSTRIGNTLSTSLTGLKRKFGDSGEIVETAWAEAESARIASDIDDLQSAALAAAQKRDAAAAKLAGGEAVIKVCTKPADREVRGRLAEERQTLTAMTFGDPEQIAKLREGRQNAETRIGEMKAKQDKSLACFKGLPDPKEIIAEVKSWDDAADLFIEAAASEAARAEQCAEKLRQAKQDDSTKQAGKADVEAAEAALSACRFKESRELINKLPEGPERAALAERWNTSYKTERKARDIVKAAVAIEEQGKLGRAIGKLREANDITQCDRTIAAIDQAISRIQEKIAQAVAPDAESALTACRFKKSRELISKLPEGPERAALAERWNTSYKTERKARDMVRAAVAIEEQGKLGRAIGKLREANDITQCDRTIAAIDRAISRIQQKVADNRKSKADAFCRSRKGSNWEAGPIRQNGSYDCRSTSADRDGGVRGTAETPRTPAPPRPQPPKQKTPIGPKPQPSIKGVDFSGSWDNGNTVITREGNKFVARAYNRDSYSLKQGWRNGQVTMKIDINPHHFTLAGSVWNGRLLLRSNSGGFSFVDATFTHTLVGGETLFYRWRDWKECMTCGGNIKRKKISSPPSGAGPFGTGGAKRR